MKTEILFKDGAFYDADYYERGKQTGKGWLENYRWMPQRSFREALAIIDFLKLNESSVVLDIGCAKGFLVRALRGLYINAFGCDISDYALSFASKYCWNCSDVSEWEKRKGVYDFAFSKDVLEHNKEHELKKLLSLISLVSKRLMVVVPTGDNGRYRISEYHLDITHYIIENEQWWRDMFESNGWEVMIDFPHLPGLKDNWQTHGNGVGNRVFLLKTK